MAPRKQDPNVQVVKLNSKQLDVIGSLSRAAQELGGRLELYTAGIGDANGVPEGFKAAGIDPDKKELTFKREQKGPQVVED